MYKVIGADGQQYGPISAEQVRRWLAEARLSAQSLIQAEGSEEWKPLGSFPEFADALRSATLPPVLAGPGPKADAEALAAEILAGDYHVDIGSCLARSWDLVTRHFWLVVGASFVLGLIQGAVGPLAGVCTGGLYFLLLRLIRGQPAQFGDAFGGFSLAFVQLFLAGLVAGLLIGLGTLCCLLPGIYLGVAWVFVLPLVIDKNLDFWPAMELSRQVVSRHWWLFFGFVLVNLLLLLLGVAACIVGVFIAQPVVLGALAYAYEDIFGGHPAAAPPPAPALKPGPA